MIVWDRVISKLVCTMAAAVALAVVGGCGGRSDIGTVSGRVTYKGQPLSGVEVQFNPEGRGRNSVGYTDADGQYEVQYTPSVKGALIGPHTVAVLDRSGKTPIPSKFTSLKFEVKPGRNQFDIDITSE